MESIKYPYAIPLKYEVFYGTKYNSHRRVKAILIGDILGRTPEFKNMSYDQQTLIIKEIEQGCYHATCEEISKYEQSADWTNIMFRNIYNYICGNLFQNIDPNSEVQSKYLIEKILNGNIASIDLCKLGEMNSDDLCPDKSIEIKKKIQERANIKFSKKICTQDTCRKCKRKEYVVERMHTRGLDESDDNRATCVFCQHTWRI